jgi:adenylate kinase family enzyme
MIIGCSGSGKSTLSRALSARTGLPIIYLDQHYFGPGWKEPSQEVWIERVTKLAAQEAWIMDGNYSGTFDYRMPRTEAVIFLDFPTWRCLWRVLKRTTLYWGKNRPSSAPDCPERYDLHFLRYVLHYRKTRQPQILRRLKEEEQRGKVIYHLRSPREVKTFLQKSFP